jgi:hypothetical protein
MEPFYEIREDAVEWIDVESSNVRRVAWLSGGDLDEMAETGNLTDLIGREADAEWQRRLLVQFNNGTAGFYLGVPQDEADALTAAESVGRQLNASIKPVYPWEPVRVREPEVAELADEGPFPAHGQPYGN